MDDHKIQRHRNHRCCRCGEFKDWYKFNDGQVWWNVICIRCQLSPAGNTPIREELWHIRSDYVREGE